MKRVCKYSLIGLGVVFLVLQVIRPTKNVAPAGPDDLIALYAPPPEVANLLTVACYDCHSNTTRYPWYSEIQPAGWWLAQHVRDGKEKLNFSEFGAYPKFRQSQKLLEAADEIWGKSMPLESYTWMHGDARFTEEQIELLIEWAETLADDIEAENDE